MVVVKEYDFYTAIVKAQELGPDELEISSTTFVSPPAAIVHTNQGDFLCESFQDGHGTIYMKVATIK